MKRLLIFILVIGIHTSAVTQQNWKPAGDKVKTAWSEQISIDQPLNEYPRPQLVRNQWMNLNGFWSYSLQPRTNENFPAGYDGKILVPFAVESALSGVGKTVGKDSVLWYHRVIDIPAAYRKGKILLHFGAVDWLCEVYVNGKKAGSHQGGFDPFSFDITALMLKSARQEISVRVWDPTDDGPQPRGKQVKKPEGIWYTPVTGIWQTVWLEAVPETYVSSTRHVSDFDGQSVSINATIEAAQTGDQVRITVIDGHAKLSEQTIPANETARFFIPNAKAWTPESPNLYNYTVNIIRKGKVIDAAGSYFAIRKISMGKDQNGIQRILLNNKFVFQYGPLDQGWWPDGLYTAPTDSALVFDIVKTKEMGFNMIRKHVKVEPARWYYHCDRLGMLVWQDMPSGDLGNRWESRPGVEGLAGDKHRTPESETMYRNEWKAIINSLFNFPSIVIWIPFNEGWGQFKTAEITEWTQAMDTTRLVNSASGGNFHPTGHIIDLHNYPEPAMPTAALFGENHALVLGEFGGLGLPLNGHTWQVKDNWGYQSFKDEQALYIRYENFVNRLSALIEKGLSAAVYTQTTDVEVEINGLMTYDRKRIKMPVEKLNKLHRQLYESDAGAK